MKYLLILNLLFGCKAIQLDEHGELGSRCEHICHSAGLILHRIKYNRFGAVESCICGRAADDD